MIPISPETYFEIYVIFLLFIAAALWLYHLWRHNNDNWSISEEKLCRCKACSLTYVVHRTEHISRCPRCNELNNLNLKVKV